MVPLAFLKSPIAMPDPIASHCLPHCLNCPNICGTRYGQWRYNESRSRRGRVVERRSVMARESVQRKETQSALDIYADLATPGAPHKLLARMAGTWSMKGSCRMEPGGDWIEHTGISVQRSILDGRFLQQDFKGEMLGISFSGVGYTGYDNHKEKYVSTWLDSFGTGIYNFEGTGSADGSTITQTC